ncbi:MAG: hypothetical protein ACOYOK_11910 [Pseudobdellovibrionaceae bacterium]
MGQTKKIRPSIKKDRIHPKDFLQYPFIFSCEDCSHFDPDKNLCTIGYATVHHRRAEQLHSYEVSGKVAFCRFHEID